MQLDMRNNYGSVYANIVKKCYNNNVRMNEWVSYMSNIKQQMNYDTSLSINLKKQYYYLLPEDIIRQRSIIWFNKRASLY